MRGYSRKALPPAWLALLVLYVGALVPGPAESRGDQPNASGKPRQLSPAHDVSRFREAYDLISGGRGQAGSPLPDADAYERALRLLQKNIGETPDAVDVDYDYAWAMVCAANLGRYELALDYYRIIVTDFYGWVTNNGVTRNWIDQRETVRNELAQQKTGESGRILKEMTKLEDLAAQRFQQEALALIRQASDGDKASAEALNSRRYQQILVTLIAQKKLILADSKEDLHFLRTD